MHQLTVLKYRILLFDLLGPMAFLHTNDRLNWCLSIVQKTNLTRFQVMFGKRCKCTFSHLVETNLKAKRDFESLNIQRVKHLCTGHESHLTEGLRETKSYKCGKREDAAGAIGSFSRIACFVYLQYTRNSKLFRHARKCQQRSSSSPH